MTLEFELWVREPRLRGVLHTEAGDIIEIAGHYTEFEELPDGHASVELHLWPKHLPPNPLGTKVPGVCLNATLPPPIADLVRRASQDHRSMPPDTESVRVPLVQLSIPAQHLFDLLNLARDKFTATVRLLTGSDYRKDESLAQELRYQRRRDERGFM